MKNFAQVFTTFKSKSKEYAHVVGNTKYKAFEINFSEPSPQGIVQRQKFVRETCPKRALREFKLQMNARGQEFYEVTELVAPNKREGLVVYKVHANLHILR